MKYSLSCQAGTGLRARHFPYLEQHPATPLKWFEALTENYLDSQGRPRHLLNLIRSDYAVALHGVSLSIGSSEGIRAGYLSRLKKLIDEIDPFIVSDHLCWTGLHQANSHDLLPLPYTQETLNIVLNNLAVVQDFLGRQFVLENPSSYMTFRYNEWTEWDFLVEIARRSGAKILLDINNVYVSATNHGFDPRTYLAAVPPDLVAQIHLAGFTDMGTHLFDTHSKPVYEPVWELFSEYIAQAPGIPFMVEWDDDIPEFEVLITEVMKAVRIWELHHGQSGAYQQVV